MTCSRCGREDIKEELESRLRWLNYERDMIMEEGTQQESFAINQKIINLHRQIILANIIFRD